MNNKIDNHTKKERARRLIEVSQELEIKYMEKFMNQEVEVLVEENIDGYSVGHTGNFIHVKIKGEYPHNEMKKATIKRIEYPYCIAE